MTLVKMSCIATDLQCHVRAIHTAAACSGCQVGNETPIRSPGSTIIGRYCGDPALISSTGPLLLMMRLPRAHIGVTSRGRLHFIFRHAT